MMGPFKSNSAHSNAVWPLPPINCGNRCKASIKTFSVKNYSPNSYFFPVQIKTDYLNDMIL